MIQIQNLTKYYGTSKNITKALENINLTLPDSGMVFIVGKSGSGKSTLLNILGGLDYPTSGQVIIDNRPLSSFSRRDFDAYRNSHIGFIFQTFNLIEDNTVFENIALSLKIQAVGHDYNAIEDVLKMVGLDGMGYRKINELSGGQKQRVAIARVLVKNPKLILADEPTGSLDSTTGEEIIANLKVISKDRLVIVVTHDQLLAQKYGDRIIQVSDGHIVKDIIRIEQGENVRSEFINSSVIRVPVGGKIADEKSINDKLDENENNYLCISTSAEKVVLAHPETFEALFEKQDYDSDFKESDDKVTLSSKKNLKLDKSHLPLKEALKMMWESLRKMRVRFTTLIFLSTIALTLLSVASSLSNITNDTIVASTIKARNERILTLTKSSPTSTYILEDDYNNLKFAFPNLPLKKSVDISMGVRSANPPTGMVEYYFRDFNGVIETSDLNDLNLKLVAGTGKFKQGEYQEIIISDYVASELIRQGFIGVKDGHYGVFYLINYSEFIDVQILFEDGYLYKVIGVFETDYEYVNEHSPSEFKNLKNIYYGRLVVNEGFINNYLINIPHYTQKLSLGYTFANSRDSMFTTADGVYKYDKAALEPRLLVGELPEKLSDSQVVIDFTTFSRLMGQNYFETKEEVLSRWNYYKRRFFDPSFNLSLSIKGEKVATYQNYKIIALIDDEVGNKGQIYFGDNFQKEIKKTSLLTKTLLMSSAYNVDELTSLIIQLRNTGYNVGTSIFKSYTKNTEDLKTLANTATYGAYICGVFAILLIANFVISSIRQRKREIGILRSCGASPFDVLKIFLSEVIFCALIVAVISLILTFGAYQVINLVVSNSILQGMSIVTFRLKDGINITLTAFASMIIVALVPILKISYLKPIDALNDAY